MFRQIGILLLDGALLLQSQSKSMINGVLRVGFLAEYKKPSLNF